MASNINPLHPIAGTPTTQSVRDNFAHAKTEIEALQVAAGAGGGSGGLQPLTINDQSGASYTIQASDINDVLVRMAVPQNQMGNIVIPTDANMNVPIGSSLMVSSNGIGVVNITGENGVAVRSPQSKTIDRKYGRIVVIKTGNNEWEIDGQLVNQLQYFVTPYDADWYQSNVTLGHSFLPPGTPLSISFSMYGVSTFSPYASINDVMQSSGSQAYNTPGNVIQFGTAEPIDLYFRAVLESGTCELRVQHILGMYEYFGLGEWAQYKQPNPGNGYGQQNPRWEVLNPVLTATPGEPTFKLRFDVSELPSESGIIGSFTWQCHTPYQKHLKELFANSARITGQQFYISQLYTIDTQQWNTVNSATMVCDLFASNMTTLAPGFDWDWSQAGAENIFFRVTTPNGFPNDCTYTGGLSLGEIVSGTNISNNYQSGLVSFTGPDTAVVEFKIEVMSDIDSTFVRTLSEDTVFVGVEVASLPIDPPGVIVGPGLDLLTDITSHVNLNQYFSASSGGPITSTNIDTPPTGVNITQISTTRWDVTSDDTAPTSFNLNVSATNVTNTVWNIISCTNSVQYAAPFWTYESDPYITFTAAVFSEYTGYAPYDLSQFANGQGITYSIVDIGSPWPPGLSLNTTTGVISGEPTGSDYFTAAFMLTNNGGESSVGYMYIDVSPLTAPGWNVTYDWNGYTDYIAYPTQQFTVGYAVDPIDVSSTNNVSSGMNVTYSIIEGTLPDGLTLNSSTGIISGTPTAVTPAADIVIELTNSGGSSGPGRMSIEVTN